MEVLSHRRQNVNGISRRTFGLCELPTHISFVQLQPRLRVVVQVGVGVGNLVAQQLDAPFVLPWDWVFVALALSGAVSLGSGYYPARRAAQLDPIESLRHA